MSDYPVPGSGFRVRWDRVSALAVVVLVLLLFTVRSATADRPRGAHATAAATAATDRPAVAAPASTGTCPAVSGLPVRAAPAVAASAQQRTVALSFDDGPSAYTPEVLDVLRRYGVHATFFMIGKDAAQKPAIVRTVLAAGHQIGNHSWSHQPPAAAAGWRPEVVDAEIQRTGTLLKGLTRQSICWFRPPAGIMKGLAPEAERYRQAVALWSVDTRDWAVQRPGIADPAAIAAITKIAAAGLHQAHPVLLMHDGGGRRSATVAALPKIIESYQAHCYAFVRLDGR